MAGVTLVQAQEMLSLYLTAEQKILTGQAYSIGDRSLTRADLRWVAQERKKWDDKVKELTNSRTGPSIKRVLPRDV